MKNKLVIHSVSVWGHPNIRTWEPEDPRVIAELVFLDIGLKAQKSFDSFSIRVATPEGLTRLQARDGVLAVRPLLIMNMYDFNNLWHWLEHTIQKCASEDWGSCVNSLRLYFDWEYQNYQEI